MNQEAGASAGDPDSYINEYIHIVQHICCSIYSIYEYIAISQDTTSNSSQTGQTTVVSNHVIHVKTVPGVGSRHASIAQ